MLDTNDAATFLNISRSEVYALIRAGKLAHYRLGSNGGAIRFTEKDLQAYVKSCRVKATHSLDVELRNFEPQDE